MNLKIRFILVFIFLSASFSKTFSQEPWNLQQCVDYALEHNIQIKQAQINAEYNENLLDQSRFNRYPNLNANLGYGVSFGRALDPTTYEFTEDQTVHSLNPNISSSVTLFSGFQLKNTIEQNRFNLLAALQDLEKLKNDISLTIAGQYLQILFNSEILAVAREQLEVTNSQVTRTQALVDAGSVAKGTLLEIQAQLAADELSVINAENNLSISYLTLSQLLELDSVGNFSIVIPEITNISEENLLVPVDQIYREALEILPQIKAAEYGLRSAEKGLDIARGSGMPRLSLSASYGSGYSDSRQQVTGSEFASDTIPTLGGDALVFSSQNFTFGHYPLPDQLSDYRNTSLYATLSIPVFNRFMAKNNVKNAKLAVENSMLEEENQKKMLYKEIQQAYADAVAGLKKFRASEQAVVSMEESFKYTREKYEVGLVNAVDFNIAQNQLIMTQSELLRAKYDFIFKTSILSFYRGKPLSLDQL